MNRIHLKPEAAVTGFFYLDHLPTGKVFTGVSKNIQMSIQEIAQDLEQNRCLNIALAKLYHTDPSFKAYWHKTNGIREAKSMERQYRADKPEYLLIN